MLIYYIYIKADYSTVKTRQTKWVEIIYSLAQGIKALALKQNAQVQVAGRVPCMRIIVVLALPVAGERGARHRLRHMISESSQKHIMKLVPVPLYSHNAYTSHIYSITSLKCPP